MNPPMSIAAEIDAQVAALKRPARKDLKTVRVAGLATIVATRRDLAEVMVDDCLANRKLGLAPRLVFSSNGQGISLVGANPAFAETMQEADIVHADGMSAVFASRMLTRTPLPERIATTDFFHDAAKAAIQTGLRFYFLGASEAQNAAAVDAARRLYPELEIVGRRNGYFKDSDNEKICAEIVAANTDVLWVALGKPKQEFWCVENRARMSGVGWIKTCGGLYGFLAGQSRRAPAWMQRSGLEWLHRMMEEPTRLGPRYVATNAHAIWRLLRYTS